MYDLLSGLRVIECSAFVAAPSCGLYLAQMGAEVIRIDTVGGGPDSARWPLAADGSSFYWEGLNKSKKSVAIDFSLPEGRELIMALATASGDRAGLFVTNLPAEGFLAYDKLAALRRDLICVRVMGWADGGAAVDYTVNAAVGVPLMTGPRGDARPVNHVLPAWDLLTGAYAAFAICAALLDRQKTGIGREIRIPLSDIAATTLANLGMTAETQQSGVQRERMGNDLFGAFGRDFVTKDDRRIMVVAITPRQWNGLVEALDLTESISAIEARVGATFAKDEGARFKHRNALFPVVEQAISRRPLAEIARAFDRSSVCWSEFQPLQTALQDPRLFADNPLFSDIAHPSGQRYPTPGAAATIFPGARRPASTAPRLGGDTRAVLQDILGMSSDDVARLDASGVIRAA